MVHCAEVVFSARGPGLGRGAELWPRLRVRVRVAPAAGAVVGWAPVLEPACHRPTVADAGRFGVGCGDDFGALNVYYRDFRYVLPVGMQLWMFASPVAYPLTTVRAEWRSLYLIINPAAGTLDGFSRVLVQGQWPDPSTFGVSAAVSCAILCFGYWVFKGMEPGFADAV